MFSLFLTKRLEIPGVLLLVKLIQKYRFYRDFFFLTSKQALKRER